MAPSVITLTIFFVQLIAVQAEFGETGCMYEHNGASYTGQENVTSNGSPCLNWKDARIVAKGFSKNSFPDGDNEHNYCRNPRRERGNLAVKPWCYLQLDDQITFELCDQISRCDCPRGFYGDACNIRCRCRDRDDSCSRTIGSCPSGCASGWTGIGCQKKCDTGYYGFQCTRKCHNCYKSRCDPETGSCLDGCDLGLTGENCDETCSAGWYGRNCEHQCGNCSKSEPCHHKTGKCFPGCAPGFTGYLCTESCDEPGPYGGCVRSCGICSDGMICSKPSGRCVIYNPSVEGEEIKRSPETFSPKILIAVLVVGFVLVLLIAAVSFFVRKRSKTLNSEQEEDVLQGCLENYRREESLDVPDSPRYTTCEPSCSQLETRGGQLKTPGGQSEPSGGQPEPLVVQDFVKMYVLKKGETDSETNA